MQFYLLYKCTAGQLEARMQLEGMQHDDNRQQPDLITGLKK